MDLLKKLRLDNSKSLWVINAPGECIDYFADYDVKQRLGKQKPLLQVILFVYNSAELADYIHRLSEYISHDTLFWICYPKKSGSISSDLIQMKAWDVVFNSGYRGQTSASIDDDWSGLRVTNAPRAKPSQCDLPMEQRVSEGIDYVKRTVTLPKDAQAAVDKHKGLSDYFYSQSFTCKKEYVESITQAKKPETRARRIDKMIEMLFPKMQARTIKGASSKKSKA